MPVWICWYHTLRGRPEKLCRIGKAQPNRPGIALNRESEATANNRLIEANLHRIGGLSHEVPAL